MVQAINIFGTIGIIKDANGTQTSGFTLEMLKEKLLPATKSLVLHINSRGGYAFEGWLIHDYLKELQKKGISVKTVAGEDCMSAATIIHLAVPKENRFVSENTNYMIHEAWIDPSFLRGRSSDLLEAGFAMKEASDTIKGLYATESNLDVETLDYLLEQQTNLNADDCLEVGFAIGVVQPYKPLLLNNSDTMILQKWQNKGLDYAYNTVPQIDSNVLNDIIIYFSSKYGEKIITSQKIEIGMLKPISKHLDSNAILTAIGANEWKQATYLVTKGNYLINNFSNAGAGVIRNSKQLVNVVQINKNIDDLLHELNSLKITYKSKTKNMETSKKPSLLERLKMAFNQSEQAEQATATETEILALSATGSGGEVVTVNGNGSLGDTVTNADGSPAMDGDYLLEDGVTVIAVMAGIISEVATQQAETAEDTQMNAVPLAYKKAMASVLESKNKQYAELKAQFDAQKVQMEQLLGVVANANANVKTKAVNFNSQAVLSQSQQKVATPKTWQELKKEVSEKKK